MNEMKYRKEVEFGLSRQQWYEMWEDAKWRDSVVKTCLEVATCPHAAVMDRELAVAVWGTLIATGLADEKTPEGQTFPQLYRDVQLSVVTGGPEELDEDLRERCNERMSGVKWTMDTVAKFLDIGELLRGSLDQAMGRIPGDAN